MRLWRYVRGEGPGGSADRGVSGEDMQDLFITTASCGETDESLIPEYPQGGDLFRVRIDGVKGVERFKFAA